MYARRDDVTNRCRHVVWARCTRWTATRTQRKLDPVTHHLSDSMATPDAPTLPTPVVSADWLAAHLDHPRVRVLDASWYLPTMGRDVHAEYAARHIPGAVFADLGVLSDETAPFPHTLLDAERFAARMGALGVGNDDAVVVYDSSGQNFSAPRTWWMLRTMGHTNVAVLDGGLPHWIASGHATTDEVRPVVPTTFTATRDSARVRDLAAMRALIAAGTGQVADARSPGRFQATEPEPRAGVRGGHMPGAANVHYATLVQGDGTLRSREELRELFARAGIDPSKPVVASCGTGVTACAVVLALEAVGATETAVYDGSWTEWGSQPDTPVATGA